MRCCFLISHVLVDCLIVVFIKFDCALYIGFLILISLIVKLGCWYNEWCINDREACIDTTFVEVTCFGAHQSAEYFIRDRLFSYSRFIG